jgi:hypothetical protein
MKMTRFNRPPSFPPSFLQHNFIYLFEKPLANFNGSKLIIDQEFLTIEETIGDDGLIYEKGLTEFGIFFRLKKVEENNNVVSAG